MESGNELLSLVTHTGPVVCAVFSDDEQSLFSAGWIDYRVWVAAPIRLARLDGRSGLDLDRRRFEVPPPRHAVTQPLTRVRLRLERRATLRRHDPPETRAGTGKRGSRVV